MTKNATTIEILNTSNLPLPSYQTNGAAGFDLYAVVNEPITIEPQAYTMIPTGIHMALPAGYELQIRSRSGLAAKSGISVLQGIGTIDSDYRGEVKVLLVNHGTETFTVNHGDRIAQGVINRYEQVKWDLVESLDETDRGHGGFGSTGA